MCLLLFVFQSFFTPFKVTVSSFLRSTCTLSVSLSYFFRGWFPCFHSIFLKNYFIYVHTKLIIQGFHLLRSYIMYIKLCKADNFIIQLSYIPERLSKREVFLQLSQSLLCLFFNFAHHYYQNLYWFVFLQLLRCFTSLGFLNFLHFFWETIALKIC